MNITFSYVTERDIDLLVLEQFISDMNFAQLFMSKIGIKDFVILSANHSIMDPVYGESDITIIVESQGVRIGILIEDKIDANAMDKQYDRYVERAQISIQKNEYDRYYIFILAPKKYLQAKQEAKNYPNKVSYEELTEYFSLKKDRQSFFKCQLLNKAIEKQSLGYLPIEDVLITKFWSQYYSYKELYYPSLLLNRIDGPRGSNATWPWFNTAIKGIKIVHKSNKGFVDLVFKRDDINIEYFNNLMQPYLIKNMLVLKLEKSLVIRMIVPLIDFRSDFQNYSSQIRIVFDTIQRLDEFTVKNHSLLTQFLKMKV